MKKLFEDEDYDENENEEDRNVKEVQQNKAKGNNTQEKNGRG